MQRKPALPARFALAACSVGLACSLSLWTGVVSAAAAAARPSGLPVAVKAAFPLAVAGLTTNSDGSRTLWVLNTQRKRIVVEGSSIFSIIDVVFRGSPGYKLEVASGVNCSVAAASDGLGGSSIECLPTIEPNRLLPVVTFTSDKPYPAGANPTVEVNSSSKVTVASNVAIPQSARTPAAIRRFLERRFATLGLRSTVVRVTAGKPSENAFSLSVDSVPRGWVTFIVTNRGLKHHAFVVCPNGGLLNACLASSGGASYAQEYDNTGALTRGQSASFSMKFSEPGSYEYLSDLPGQAEAGAKGDLRVT